MQTLPAWMKFVLRFVAGFNLLAGAAIFCFFRESYRALGLSVPEPALPVQLLGALVGLFGVGYWMVASHPVENRNLLLLGFWSKLLGSVLGVYYVAVGKLPVAFLAVLFFSDVIYLPLFYVILRRLSALAAERDALLSALNTQWNDRSLSG